MILKAMATNKIPVPKHRIENFCKRHQIKRLALFGSVLRKDFRDGSDVDVLVEFDSKARIGLIRLSQIESELSEIIGINVDLNTPDFLSKYYRDQILSDMEVQYDAP